MLASLSTSTQIVAPTLFVLALSASTPSWAWGNKILCRSNSEGIIANVYQDRIYQYAIFKLPSTDKISIYEIQIKNRGNELFVQGLDSRTDQYFTLSIPMHIKTLDESLYFEAKIEFKLAGIQKTTNLQCELRYGEMN